MSQTIRFIVLNLGVWIFWFYFIGYLASRIPDKFLEKDFIFTKLFSFETDASWFRKILKIDKWKDNMPELGGFFGDGFEKRSVAYGEINQLKQFILETRRAEIAHWFMIGGWILTTTFNPLWAVLFNIIFAHAVNFPCLIIQRYNRARLINVLNKKLGSS